MNTTDVITNMSLKILAASCQLWSVKLVFKISLFSVEYIYAKMIYFRIKFCFYLVYVYGFVFLWFKMTVYKNLIVKFHRKNYSQNRIRSS